MDIIIHACEAAKMKNLTSAIQQSEVCAHKYLDAVLRANLS